MSKVTKVQTKMVEKEPADLVFVSCLVDESSSMAGLQSKVKEAVATVLQKIGGRPEVQVSIHKFATKRDRLIAFGTASAGLTTMSINYNPNGGTRLYGSLLDAIKESRLEAKIAEDLAGLKVHHLFAIVTDGEDNQSTDDEVDCCRAEIQKIDVHATFILLDFSEAGNSGERVGLKSIAANISDFSKTMQALIVDLEKVADNVMRQLAPDQGLLLLECMH